MAKARDLIVAHHSGYATESPEVEPSGVHLPAPPPPVPAPLRARTSAADVAAYVLAVLGIGSAGLLIYGLFIAGSPLWASVGAAATGLCLLAGIGLKASLWIAGRRTNR